MADNNFKETVGALFDGIEGMLTSKTVVGDAIYAGDTILIPLVDISLGMGAGTSNGDKKARSSGGLTGKVTPTAMLVIQDGRTKLVNIKNQDTVSKILDMVPEILDKFGQKKEPDVTEEDVMDMLNEE